MRAALPLTLVMLATGCAAPEPPAPPPEPPTPAARPDGGMPATGPGGRYNACERIWCLKHEANFALDHFLRSHDGWTIHDEALGDVFVPRGWDRGPGFPEAGKAALNLCGAHVHPWTLGAGGAFKKTGFNLRLDYSRAHFGKFGTRFEPCCVSGQAWAFLHSAAPRQFRFADLELYRSGTATGWQRPPASR